jgi:hypothetical protein
MHRRTEAPRILTAVAVAFLVAGSAQAQNDVRQRLETRGLPADLVEQVTAIAAEATAQGLPADPLASKAIEGFAKQVPAARIVAALRDYSVRMQSGREAVRDAGVTLPAGDVITAAADAMGRGLQPAQIGQLVRAAPQAQLVSPGLTVAAALTAQGMPAPRAVAVVTAAMQSGSSSSQILDLPSTAQAMQQRGMTPDQAGERMMHGGGGGGMAPHDGFGGGEGEGGAGRHGQGGEGRSGPGAGSGPAPPPQRPPDGRHGNEGPGGGHPPRP